MKHFLCRHVFIYVCVMFFVCYMYSLCCALLRRSCVGRLWRFCGIVEGWLYFSHGKSLKKNCYCPVGHKKIPARLRTSKPALLPASGRNRACPPPESAKLRDFFCTPQRAGIQRVTSVSREIPENFSKISSPKIWCVCQKSVPLHSQNRNEAYNTSQIWSNSIFENIT